MDRKFHSFRRLAALLIPPTAIAAAVVIALNGVMYSDPDRMDYLFGAGEMVVEQTGPVTDTQYNKKTTADRDAAMSEMAALNREIAAESVVLLKNNRGALPLSAGERKLNVFGWYFENSPYCAPKSSSSSSSGDFTTPYEALVQGGFSVNEQLLEEIRDGVPEYRKSAPAVGRWSSDWAIPEYVPTPAQIEQAKEFSSVALIWFSRILNEGSDAPRSMDENAFKYNSETVGLGEEAKRRYGFDPERHYQELTETEEKLVEAVTSAGFGKVIVVINSDNPMELSFLEENDGIDGALLAGGMGFYGFDALPKMLSGECNPSGRLNDTFSADFKQDPVWCNHSDSSGVEYLRNGLLFAEGTAPNENYYENLTPAFIAENGLRSNGDTMRYVFQNYEEGIYLGYRYYETRYGGDETEYRNKVVYPFGYGRSYTEFSQTITAFDDTGDQIELSVTVKNIGSRAGKEVVQLYVTPPYGAPDFTEKSSVVLCDFGKTELLQPGQEQTVGLAVAKEDLASYDDAVHKCYVLDAGEYVFSVRGNAHEVIEGATRVWKNGKQTVFDATHPRNSEKYAHNASGVGYRAATNAFDETLVGISPEFTELSRADFEGTFPQPASKTDRTASPELIEKFKRYDVNAMNDPSDKMPERGEGDHRLQLIDLRGLPFDDPSWEAYLDEWTTEKMLSITLGAGSGIEGVKELGVPASVNSDGTMGIKYRSIDFTVYGTILPLSCTACCTARCWNQALLRRLGEVCGEEALQFGMNGWYAPALNLHRSPLAGRCFDYYSEDPLLSGKLGAFVCSGAGSKGVVTYLKHFALNEDEYFRNYSSVWASEQAMRELYLKPFEIAIKQSKMTVRYYKDGELKEREMSAVHGVMSAFNRVGNTWAGGNADLLKTVLRKEWGFHGVVMTDNMRTQWVDMNPDLMLRNGGTNSLSSGKTLTETESATIVTALREATHEIAFAIANSNAMNGIAPGSSISYRMAPWERWLLAGDILAAAAVIGTAAALILRKRGERLHPDRYDNNAVI